MSPPRAVLTGALLALAAGAFALGIWLRSDESEAGPEPPPAPREELAVRPPVALAVEAPPPPPPYEPLIEDGPPRPRGEGGIRGFVATSRVVFVGNEDRPHTLEATYLFPERTKLLLSLIEGEVATNQLQYRYGRRAFEAYWENDVAGSREYTGGRLWLFLRHVELRRAALLWPDGHAWSGKERELEAPLLVAGESEPYGRLVATLPAGAGVGALPERFTVLDADGTPTETLAVTSWDTEGKRTRPQQMSFVVHQGTAERTIWEEVVESFETRVHFTDFHFLPADRFPRQQPTMPRSVQPIQVPAVSWRRAPLDAPAAGGGGRQDWPALIEAARARIDAARAELAPAGLEVDPRPTFELAPDGRPLAQLVRLSAAADPPPDGWTTTQRAPGALLILAAPADLGVMAMKELRDALPRTGSRGQPYLRVHEDGGAQVVWPMNP